MISYLIVLFHTLTESVLDAPCDINPSKLYFLCRWSNKTCVLSLSLYVFQFMYCYVVVPQNTLTNKIWIFFFSFLPPFLISLFLLTPSFLSPFLSFHGVFIFCVKCSAVTNTYCTTGFDAVCCFRPHICKPEGKKKKKC